MSLLLLIIIATLIFKLFTFTVLFPFLHFFLIFYPRLGIETNLHKYKRFLYVFSFY